LQAIAYVDLEMNKLHPCYNFTKLICNTRSILNNSSKLVRTHLEPVDYLVFGHITQDLIDSGSRIGGTVTYSGLTAKALGHSVGIVTSFQSDLDVSACEGLQIVNHESEHNSTFRNIPSPKGRTQFLYHKAHQLSSEHIPAGWIHSPIVHLGPVANEVDPDIINHFPNSQIFLTPQGWLRATDAEKKVHPIPWNLPPELTSKATAIVLSVEDVQGDESQISELVSLCRLVVVTENKYGARVYWNGDVRYFAAPEVELVEDTGAGDIFAALFFSRLTKSRDPWESARFAVKLSTASVTRRYLDSIPTQDEIRDAKVDIIIS